MQLGLGARAPIAAERLSLKTIFRNLQAPGPGKSFVRSHSVRVTELIVVPSLLHLFETGRLVGLLGQDRAFSCPEPAVLVGDSSPSSLWPEAWCRADSREASVAVWAEGPYAPLGPREPSDPGRARSHTVDTTLWGLMARGREEPGM